MFHMFHKDNCSVMFHKDKTFLTTYYDGITRLQIEIDYLNRLIGYMEREGGQMKTC